MIDKGAPLHDPAKYDGDHRWSRWVRTRYRCRNLREETPFSEFTSFESWTVGGYSISRCTWSSSPLHSVSTAPKSALTSATTSASRVRCSDVTTFRRYLVTKTKCTCSAETHVLPRRMSLSVDDGTVGACSPDTGLSLIHISE